MGEGVVIRVFFSSFLDDVAKAIISRLSKYGRTKTMYSRIVPGFYHVEIILDKEENIDSIVGQIESEIRKLGSDYVYGIKVYYIKK